MEATRKLVEAVRGEDLEAARLALETGADPNYLEGANSDSILNEAVSWIEGPDLRMAMIRLLLESGADPNLIQDENLVPLYAALKRRDVDLVRWLLDYGADPNLVGNGPGSIYDNAEFDYRFYVWDLKLDLTLPLEAGATPDELLEYMDQQAADCGMPRPDHLILMRQRGAKTLREIEVGRVLDAIQEVLGKLRIGFHLHWQDDGETILVASIAGSRLAIYVGFSSLKAELAQSRPMSSRAWSICQELGLNLHQIRVFRDYHSGNADYLFQGVDSLVNDVRGNRVRWQAHLLGGVRGCEWAARLGSFSDLRLNTVGGRLRLRIDGEFVRLPIGDEGFLQDPPVDVLELCRSACTDDECWIFTCGCGVPECNGIYSGIQVAHQDGFTIWRSPETPEVPLAVFRRWQYRRVVLQSVRALLRQRAGDRFARSEFIKQRRRLEWAYRRTREAQPWFVGPELHSQNIIDY